MTAVVGPEQLRKTQEELGRFIKKPPLTDKLLNKPPFRFLHDIINAIVTETGFLSGLFTEDELSSQNIKDKDAKISFLQKCIDATVLSTGENLTVRPSKIVAGHEADKTNEWLQALGRAIAQKVDSSEAVSKVLSGVKPQTKKSDKRSDKTREKSDKTSDKEKKAVAANSKGLRNNTNPTKDPKSAKVRTAAQDTKASPNPRPADPRAATGSRGGRKPKSPPDPKQSTNSKLAVEARNVPLVKPSTKPIKGSTVKSSSKSKDEKEKTSKKPKSRPKEEESGSKSSKDGRSRESKADKEKKPKNSSPEKAKSSKSRPASRAAQAKDTGKENSPPHEVIGGDEILTNGHAAAEEMVSTPKLAPSRPPSARLGSRTAAEDGLMMPSGPASLIHSMEGEQQPQSTGGEGQEEQPNNSNSIDPAILKAMAPNNDQLQGNDQLDALPQPEPPDSGVGSLESPKHSTKDQESLPLAPTPRPGPPPGPPPGPQPLRAMEAFDGGTIPAQGALPPGTQTPGNEFKEPVPGEAGIRPRTGRRSARPPSARPAPPRVRERREIPKEEIQRPGTAKPVANVILSSTSHEGDDDDDNFTVEESKPVVAVEEDPLPLDAAAASGAAAAAAAAGEDGQGAGLLIAQILETKKEMEDGRRNAFSPETPGHRRVPIEQSLLSDANRKKEREVIQKDVQKLSTSIQSITRSVNPLAKMLDYLQEDLDSMQKELESWQNENRQLAHTLKQEQSATEQALEPLGYQLMELETAVQDQRDKLSAVKSNILRNNEKISRLMAGINLNI